METSPAGRDTGVLIWPACHVYPLFQSLLQVEGDKRLLGWSWDCPEPFPGEQSMKGAVLPEHGPHMDLTLANRAPVIRGI